MQSLVLDLGNVVAFFDHHKACAQIAALAAAGTTSTDVFERVFGSTLEEDFDCGRISTPEFVAVLRDQFGITASDSAIGNAWSDIFLPNDEVVSLLPVLKASTAKLVLASNTNDLHYRWLASRLEDTFACFDELVLSFQLGARKPALTFFRQCVEAAGTEPRECIYVDDRDDYVEVASAAGMTGLVYSPDAGFARMLIDAGIKL